MQVIYSDRAFCTINYFRHCPICMSLNIENIKEERKREYKHYCRHCLDCDNRWIYAQRYYKYMR